MREHTPGPWSVAHFADDSTTCNCDSVLSLSYFGRIASIGIGNELPVGDGGNDCPPLEEARANANLMAAAPDLLAACRLFERWDTDPHGTEADAASLRRAIAAAIAKAEGGTR